MIPQLNRPPARSQAVADFPSAYVGNFHDALVKYSHIDLFSSFKVFQFSTCRSVLNFMQNLVSMLASSLTNHFACIKLSGKKEFESVDLNSFSFNLTDAVLITQLLTFLRSVSDFLFLQWNNYKHGANNVYYKNRANQN